MQAHCSVPPSCTNATPPQNGIALLAASAPKASEPSSRMKWMSPSEVTTAKPSGENMPAFSSAPSVRATLVPLKRHVAANAPATPIIWRLVSVS